MISRRTLLALASSAGAAVAVSACSDSSSAKKPRGSAQAGSSDAGSSATSAESEKILSVVKVSGGSGKEPKISLSKPLEFEGYHSRVITKGAGEQVKPGAFVVTRSAIFDAEKGKMLASRWKDKSVSVFPVDKKTIGPDAANFFTSTTVGSRYLMAGQAQGQRVIEVGDVVTVTLSRAEGSKKVVPAELPAFTLEKNGAPKLQGKPKAAAPKELVQAVSIEGSGAAATKGTTLVMHYRGWDWETGKEFDSSWGRGAPFAFPLGEGKVIKGWDTALEGKKAGSQVVMAIPPAQAYGDQGELAGKTLLFVADILAVVPPAQ